MKEANLYEFVRVNNYYNEGIPKGEFGEIMSLGIHPIYETRMALVKCRNGKWEWLSLWELDKVDTTTWWMTSSARDLWW